MDRNLVLPEQQAIDHDSSPHIPNYESDQSLVDKELQSSNQYYSSDDSKHSNEDEEEDGEIMPFSPSSINDNSNSSIDDSADSSSVETDDDDDEYESDGLDSLSVTAPPTLPALLLDLEKLCGYRPSDENELEQITNEIRDTLHGNFSEIDGKRTEDDTSLDFISKSRELFEAGIAQHCTNIDTQLVQSDDIPRALVHYPEFIPLPMGGMDSETSSVVTTKLIWKKIIQPHDIPVVDKLLALLSKCSRDLVWKYQMMMEVRNLSRDEKRRKDARLRQKELRKWRLEIRPAELAKLYDVRETFEIRLHASREKYSAFVRDREVRVQRELRRRAENGTGTGGIAALDWNANVTFGFGEDVEDVVKRIVDERTKEVYSHDQNDDLEEEVEQDDVHSNSRYSSTSSMDGTMSAEKLLQSTHITNTVMPLPISSAVERKKRRSATAKRRSKKMQNEQEMEELRQKIKKAYAEEEAVRQMLTSTDEKFAHSIVLNLEKKLEKVDELLDSLQEEEWKDEEEGLLDDDTCPLVETDEEQDNEKEPRASLLDQVLAMILSALPMEGGTDASEHYTNLKSLHTEIVQEWKTEFGRLPTLDNAEVTDLHDSVAERIKPDHADDEAWGDNQIPFQASSFTTMEPKPQLNQQNIVDDWEDAVDDLDDFFFARPTRPPEESIVKRETQRDVSLPPGSGSGGLLGGEVVSLRPGGGAAKKR